MSEQSKMSQSDGPRRFQINPGPLKRVERKALATRDELAESVRCRKATQSGTRCTRIQESGSNYCWQHGRQR